MVLLQGLDSKTYGDRVAPGKPIPAVACPRRSCGGLRLRGHGWHERYLGGERIWLRRLRCPGCGVSHVLLPEDVCAFQDLTLDTLEEALQAPGPRAAADAAGQVGEAAVRRARRWRQGSAWPSLAFLLPAAGSVWQRIVSLVGAAVGQLVRLRHWLWSHRRLLLGGPSGLFRGGRPRGDRGGDSP